MSSREEAKTRSAPVQRGGNAASRSLPGEGHGKCPGALGEEAVQQAKHTVAQHRPACARVASHDQRQGVTIPLGPRRSSTPRKDAAADDAGQREQTLQESWGRARLRAASV